VYPSTCVVDQQTVNQ